MAYEARRGSTNDSREQAKQRANANNAKNIRNAADVAIASKNPYAMAAGAAVKGADKLTGGRSTEALGKGMTKANQMAPGGKRIQNASNNLSESGASDKIGQAAAMKNGIAANKGQPSEGSKLVSKMPDANTNNLMNQNSRQESGGEQNSSLPSSSEKEKKKKTSRQDATTEEKEEDGLGLFAGIGKGIASFFTKQVIVTVVLFIAPILLIILLFFAAISSITGIFSEFQDAFSISSAIGEETGGFVVEEGTEDQKAFYERINEVKTSFQANGKSLDPMKIVSIYHVLKGEGADFEYNDITTSVIEKWANAMFDGNTYNESTFKENLKNSIIPEYLPNLQEDQREELAEEVLDYIRRYYDLIGKDTTSSSSSTCTSMGTCSYDIKGFYIAGKGNVVKNLKIDNLKVRLMECGQPYGNGNPTTPIDQPLVDFEEYAAGVAYAEVGASANYEVLKAQMVAARSYALARTSVMSAKSGKKLEQENGQWILQISSCVADQLFCNINEGCSFMGQSNGGHSGICRSGIIAGAKSTRKALPEDHPLRKAAAETQGEFLVNDQGYIIYTSYIDKDQKAWESMAKSGLNYKQILIQYYNQGNKNFGAKDIQKMSCGSSDNSSCISTGDFASWKQTDPEWGSVPMGDSGKNIHQIGCLATSVAILIKKSGVQVDSSINPFTPGTFVEYLNQHGGFAEGGNFVWAVATKAAPSFVYKERVYVKDMSKTEKLAKIKEIVNTKGNYAVAEVMGDTGQHWVAIDSINGDTINMMDPGSDATEMWKQYDWANTSMIGYYHVEG